MEANIQNIAHPISNHLNPQVPPVPEQAQPAPIAQPAGSQPAPLPALNQAGSLGEPVAPIGLHTRQVQQGYDVLSQSMWEAHQCLKKGKTEAAISIYTTLAEKPELDVKDRLSCAKKLLKIHTQATKAGDLLASIARDDRVDGPNRLKALQSLAESKGLEEKALEAFSALLQSQLLPEWIRDAAGGCVAPILLAKAQDLQLWPLERIQAAKQLAQIKGQVEEAAELLIAIAQDNRYHSVYRKKAAKLVSKLDKLQGQEAQKRGKELLKAIKLEDLVKKSLSKDKKQANRSYAADYLSGRCYAAEKLSSLPGQEAEASAAWTAIVNDTKPDPEKDTIRLSYDIRLSYCIKAAERLAEIKGTEHKALAIQTLEAIKNNVTLKLSYRIQAAEALSRITQGDELVDFLFELVKDIKVLSFDRIEAAERLSKLVGEDRQGEIWSALIKENMLYIDIPYGIKAAERLSSLPGWEEKAADYLICIARNRSAWFTSSIKATKVLSKIPGQERTAAELLIGMSRCGISHDDRFQIPKILSKIPGYEEEAAKLWLALKDAAYPAPIAYGAQRITRMPGQAEQTKQAWTNISKYTGQHLPKLPSQKLIYKTVGARALFEIGETCKAVEIFIACAKDSSESLDRRMLAVEHLEKIPGQEAEAKNLRDELEKALQDTKNKIETAKNQLQIPAEKEKAAQLLLAIAQDKTVPFLDRVWAADVLSEVAEQHPKAIQAWISMARNGHELNRHNNIMALERLSRIPGQEGEARKIVNGYLFEISDESRFFKW